MVGLALMVAVVAAPATELVDVVDAKRVHRGREVLVGQKARLPQEKGGMGLGQAWGSVDDGLQKFRRELDV